MSMGGRNPGGGQADHGQQAGDGDEDLAVEWVHTKKLAAVSVLVRASCSFP